MEEATEATWTQAPGSSPATKISQPNPEVLGWELPTLHSPPACARDKSSWTGVQSTRDKAL